MERTMGMWLLSTETNTAPPVIPGHMKPRIAGANVPTDVNITTKKSFVGSAKKTKEITKKEPVRQRIKRNLKRKRKLRKV